MSSETTIIDHLRQLSSTTIVGHFRVLSKSISNKYELYLRQYQATIKYLQQTNNNNKWIGCDRIKSNLCFLYLQAPLVELVQDEFVQSKVEEAAKLFYSSNTVTINLAAVAAAGLLLLLCEYLPQQRLSIIADILSAGPTPGPAIPTISSSSVYRLWSTRTFIPLS